MTPGEEHEEFVGTLNMITKMLSVIEKANECFVSGFTMKNKIELRKVLDDYYHPGDGEDDPKKK